MQLKIVPAISVAVIVIAVIFVTIFLFAPEPPSPFVAPSTKVETTQLSPEPIVSTPMHATSSAEPTPIPSAEPATPEAAIVAAPLALEESDAQVLLAAADFAPKLAQWLIPEQQIRKWILAIDLMADGKLPMRYRPLDYPMAAFAISPQEGDTIASENNYRRMTGIISVISSIDARQLARYYRQWSPILEKAYREQGKPDKFDQRLRQAISQVLASDALSGNPPLARPSVLYRYADESLEDASDIDKLLWRMGTDNSLELQQFIRELRYQLDEPS